jgi:uncharacterized protein (DUF1697 family)
MAVARHVALLRGINVGRGKRITMDRLRALCRQLGYPDAVTYLQSGNVIFTATPARAGQLPSALERLIADELEMRVRVLVRSHDELAAVVSGNPLPHWVAHPQRFMVTFLSAVPDPARVSQLAAANFLPPEHRFVGREVYLGCPDGYQLTQLSGDIWDKRLSVVATTRNWNTVTNLARMTAG